MLTSELIRDVDALDEWRGQWDELAVDAGRPFCSPGWMLAWWSDAAPARSEIAVVIVRDARRVAPAGDPESVERGLARDSAARLRKRRAKAKAARQQRKRNR